MVVFGITIDAVSLSNYCGVQQLLRIIVLIMA